MALAYYHRVIKVEQNFIGEIFYRALFSENIFLQKSSITFNFKVKKSDVDDALSAFKGTMG